MPQKLPTLVTQVLVGVTDEVVVVVIAFVVVVGFAVVVTLTEEEELVGAGVMVEEVVDGFGVETEVVLNVALLEVAEAVLEVVDLVVASVVVGRAVVKVVELLDAGNERYQFS